MSNKTEAVDFELLSRSSLLKDLSREALLQLLSAGSRKCVDAKTVIFDRGDPGNEMYFIF